MAEKAMVSKSSETKLEIPPSRLQKPDHTRSIKSSSLQAKLRIGHPNDVYEQEADRVAEQIMRMPDPALQRRCPKCDEDDKKVLQTKKSSGQASITQAQDVPLIVQDVLRSPGQPLDSATRAFMEPRFGHDFSGVRVHTDSKAGESARAVKSLAYTLEKDLVFETGQYVPSMAAGQRLLAHELTHVVQQEALPSSTAVQRQIDPMEQHMDDMDTEMERKYANSGAAKAQTCGRPSHCPAGFCSPYTSEKLAEYYRSKKSWWLMAGISAAVDSRVVPLWREYLWGGSSPKNLSADFGKDFTNSPTTKKTTTFLYNELKKSLAAKPPSLPLFSTIIVNLSTQIPKAISELDDPASINQMNFNIPKDIPGNLAGGIGKDQLACPAGAKPSPFNDERHATGTAVVTRLSPDDLTVSPIITYSVKDTIDLCPGDCGATMEKLATVPLSQFEATGISGDVPFMVDFPAPSMGSFNIPAPLSTSVAPAPASKNPPK
jgi:hypothetical protein